MVVVFPPAAQILVAPDPVLGPFAVIGNRRAALLFAVKGRCIEPVIPLAPRDIGGQVIQVGDTAPVRVGMVGAIAPIRQRHVIVDADHVDVVIRPKRVEVEEAVARVVI